MSTSATTAIPPRHEPRWRDVSTLTWVAARAYAPTWPRHHVLIRLVTDLATPGDFLMATNTPFAQIRLREKASDRVSHDAPVPVNGPDGVYGEPRSAQPEPLPLG